MVLIVMIIERELLLAIRRIIRVVEIQDNGGRGLSVAGNKVIHQGSRADDRGLCGLPGVPAVRTSAHSPSRASGSKGRRSTPSLNTGSWRR